MDTSALTKLLIAEAETPELQAWIATQRSQGEYIATSTLGRIELMRDVARYGDLNQTERALYFLEGFDIVPLTDRILTSAETLGPPTLCPLDAIHLAAASSMGEALTTFVTYDHRLLDGCRHLGITTASPGAAW